MGTCGLSGLYFVCPIRLVDDYIGLRDMTPVTHRLIQGLDYEAHSSGVMTVSLLMVAYFVYDLTFNKVGIEYIFHHSIVLVCIAIYYWCDTFVFYVAAGLMTEFSTVL